ncbi:hypothetical protein AB5I41_31375 [Sphingomonas sp. MMS24-JH45]
MTSAMADLSKPLGYMASLEDWNEAFAGRPMTIDDWNRLTLGSKRDTRLVNVKRLAQLQ